MENRALERYLTTLTILILWAGGCALTQKPAASSSPAPRAGRRPVSAAAVQLDSLPYTYTRHGVEIRVYSVELTPQGQLGVNVKLQETRGVSQEIAPSSLFQVQTSSGEVLSYVQYRRGEQIRQDVAIVIQPKEEFPIDLLYRAPAVPGPIELRFPTGKWWRSQSAE